MVRRALLLFASFLAACGGAAPGGGDGSGGDGSTSTTQSASSVVASSVAVTASSGAGGSVEAPKCDPAVPADSFWAQQAQPWDSPTPTRMCAWKGEVLLVVNVAAL